MTCVTFTPPTATRLITTFLLCRAARRSPFQRADCRLESFVSSYQRADRVEETIARYGYTDYTGIKDEAGVAADRQATDRVSALMLKLLVVLSTQPSLVEEGCCVRAQRFKNGSKHQELWTPNLIGWRYQPLRAEQPAGTHASPRLHWRRGHIRRQAHGLGRAERKLIWIEPMLIGMRQAEP